jgi:hypothetical protein
MNKKRHHTSFKRLNELYSPLGWSVNETDGTVYDPKLLRDLKCFLLTQHPNTMVLLVVEMNQTDQQEHPDFYRNKIYELKQRYNSALGNVIYLTFSNDDEIINELLTDNI